MPLKHQSKRWSALFLLSAIAVFLNLCARADVPVQVLVSFSAAGSNGASPNGLVLGGNGNFYGTAYQGGATPGATNGTVFVLASGDTFTTLASFVGTDGSNPQSALVQGSDGNFYGTTALGGKNGFGVVFQVATNGAVATLASFTGVSGNYPYYSSLVEDASSNFYGTSSTGGTYGYGSIFQVTNGTVKTLVSLNNTNGAYPYAALVQGNDGNFYGTTYAGGASANFGTVFKVTPTGTLTTLASFAGTNGAYPAAPLLLASDGNFYGTTIGGGGNGDGTVFELSTNGTILSLASFNGANGADPSAGLIQGPDGTFYGTTYSGGTSGAGTVFAATSGGGLTTLASFNGATGANPAAALVFGNDGNLYGTASTGGSGGGGVVFLLTLPPSILLSPVSQTAIAGTEAIFSVSAGGSGTLSYQWFSSTNSIGATNVSGGNSATLVISDISDADAGSYWVVVSNTSSAVTSSIATLTVIDLPVILVQPQSQTNYAGSNITLSVQATAAATLAYRWQFNGITIAAASNSSLTLSSLDLANQGAYTVSVSDPAGAVTSAAANVTVLLEQPSIVTQPTSQAVPTGANVIFSAAATGLPPLQYQWFQATESSTNALMNAGPFSGSTTSTLAITGVQIADHGSYWVVVSNSTGTATSASAILTVLGPPSYVTTQPATQVSGAGAVLNGMATASQLPLSAWFQWGTNIGYGNQTPALNATAAGTVTFVTNRITGLTAGQVYHFRLVAGNGQSMVYGADQVFGLTRDVWAWGDDDSGQTDVPAALGNLAAIAGGGYFTLALQAGGTVAAWGENSSGQTNVPSGVSNCVAIAAGYQHALALLNGGSVIAWGNDLAGQTDVPTAATNIVAVAGGDSHSLALRYDGTVLGWGGIVVPGGLSNLVAIAAGGSHDLALSYVGTVIAWGDNSYNQSDVPPGLTNVVAIAAGLYHSLALKSNGTVSAWGDDTYGQTDVPATATNVIAIAAGRLHSLALRSDGSVVGWGYDASNQTNTPAGLSDAFAIAAGAYHSLALTADQAPVTASQTVLATNGNDLVITLSASGAAGVALSYIITSLPTAGALYQYNSGSRGAAISAVNTVVSDADGRVIFAPPGDANAASFEFVASDGLINSSVATVTITVAGPPSVISDSGTEASATEAMLSAVVSPNSLPTVAWFQLGLTTNYGITTAAENLGNGAAGVAFDQTVGGLVAQKVYHCQTVASNGLGAAYGNDFLLVTTVSPVLTNLTLSASGTFHFGFTGTPQALYSAWASTNLVNWSRIGIATEDTPGVFEFNDSSASNFTQRYYELRWP
jgi:uncharacterized repeat protein (TIGR03803 family)